MSFFCTSYCNHAHSMITGRPLNHECHILPPSALRAEYLGNFDRAMEIIAKAHPMKVSAGVKCRHIWGANYRWAEHGTRESIPVCCEKCGVVAPGQENHWGA